MEYPKFAGRWGPAKIIVGKRINPVVANAPSVQATVRPMRFCTHGGTAKPKQAYTGSEVLGIGTLHKSNAQPIFSKEEAEDIAHMRR